MIGCRHKKKNSTSNDDGKSRKKRKKTTSNDDGDSGKKRKKSISETKKRKKKTTDGVDEVPVSLHTTRGNRSKRRARG